MLDCITTTAREEGLGALWKGYVPAVVRQVCYSSLALVIYEPIRNGICGGAEEPTFFQRLLAGGTAGAVSITVFNPTEVIKTQMMSSIGETRSMTHVVRQVMRQDGITGFWAGYGPNVTRTFIVNAAELGER